MELTWTHGIEKDSWYRYRLMVLKIPMVIHNTYKRAKCYPYTGFFGDVKHFLKQWGNCVVQLNQLLLKTLGIGLRPPPLFAQSAKRFFLHVTDSLAQKTSANHCPLNGKLKIQALFSELEVRQTREQTSVFPLSFPKSVSPRSRKILSLATRSLVFKQLSLSYKQLPLGALALTSLPSKSS